MKITAIIFASVAAACLSVVNGAFVPSWNEEKNGIRWAMNCKYSDVTKSQDDKVLDYDCSGACLKLSTCKFFSWTQTDAETKLGDCYLSETTSLENVVKNDVEVSTCGYIDTSEIPLEWNSADKLQYATGCKFAQASKRSLKRMDPPCSGPGCPSRAGPPCSGPGCPLSATADWSFEDVKGPDCGPKCLAEEGCGYFVWESKSFETADGTCHLYKGTVTKDDAIRNTEFRSSTCGFVVSDTDGGNTDGGNTDGGNTDGGKSPDTGSDTDTDTDTKTKSPDTGSKPDTGDKTPDAPAGGSDKGTGNDETTPTPKPTSDGTSAYPSSSTLITGVLSAIAVIAAL